MMRYVFDDHWNWVDDDFGHMWGGDLVIWYLKQEAVRAPSCWFYAEVIQGSAENPCLAVSRLDRHTKERVEVNPD